MGASDAVSDKITERRAWAVVDRELRLLEVDAAFAELAGLAPDAILGQPLGAFIPDLDAPLREVLASGRGPRRVPLRLGPGGPVPLQLAPVRTSRGTVIGAELLVEPRERALGEVAAAAASAGLSAPQTYERHLSLALDAAQMGTWEIDLETHQVRRSASTDRLFGLAADGRMRTDDDYFGRVHPEDLAPVVDAIRRTVEVDAEHAVEYRVVWPDGTIRWIASRGELVRDADGVPRRLIGALLDLTDRRAAEAALQASEERFRATFEHAPVGIAHVALDGHWLQVNERLCAIMGYPRDELLGRTFREITHPADLPPDLAQMERVLAGEITAYEMEKRFVRKDGRVIWAALTLSLVRPSVGSPYFIKVVEDITVRRTAEAALRASEARAAILLEAMPAILYSAAPDGSTTYLSQDYYTYTGTPPGSGEGAGWGPIVHPDDMAEVAGRWQTAMATGEPYEITYRMRRADGVYRWFRTRSRPLRDDQGAIVSWFGVSLDIDDAKRAEAEREALLVREQAARSRAERTAAQLAQLQEVTAALAQALTPAQVAEAVVSRSAAALGASSSTVRLVNAGAGTLDLLAAVGLPLQVTDQWRSLPLGASLPPAEVIRSGRALFLETREALRPWYEALGATAEAIGCEAFVVAPLLVEGHVIGSLAMTFDAPRAFDAEDRSFVLALAGQCAQALERARLYAAAHEAVEVRDSFIAVASHDLRTPITAILGQAQLLERRAAAEGFSERSLRSARAIGQAAVRLHRMVEALLDLSRIQTGQMSINVAPLRLGPFVRRVVDELQPTLGGHRLLLDGDDLPLLVAGDELRLEQVLHNLIGNAVKYSPDGGAVRLTLEHAGDEARIHVADRGIGISAAAMPRLFERFYRAPDAEHQAVAGLGVGLYVVHELVALHGGAVAVTSTEGVGSTFTVSLPLVTSEVVPAGQMV